MNYTLRKVIGREPFNQLIGDHYSVIYRDMDYEKFGITFKIVFSRDHVADLDENADTTTKECYGFVACKEGSEFIPLYRNQYNFIMSDCGKTFENLTYK